MRLSNKQAHEKLSFLSSIFDEYNQNGLTELSPTLLKIFHDQVIEAYEMVKFLWSKEQTEATRAYMIFCGKLLLRFSYLREHGRKENSKETSEYFRDFVCRMNKLLPPKE